jgi:aspartyl-tRNA(Asn)/glutamyl-tRNA(Gln) amidotransferase subunit A
MRFDLPWPQPSNPWHLDHTTGGSSSGTAAAVAAGLILGGTGTQTNTSICGPSALCGITGLKPTYGRVSRTGVLPLAFTLDHVGPMAWTVEDCAILLQAMAGYDRFRSGQQRSPHARFPGGAGPERARSAHRSAAALFRERQSGQSGDPQRHRRARWPGSPRRGAIVRDVKLSSLEVYHACTCVILMAEAYAIHEPWLTTARHSYGEIFRDRASLGGLIRAADYVQALRRRRDLCREVATAMVDLDVLISASDAGEAPRIVDLTKWAFPWASVIGRVGLSDRIPGAIAVHGLWPEGTAGRHVVWSRSPGPRQLCCGQRTPTSRRIRGAIHAPRLRGNRRCA